MRIGLLIVRVLLAVAFVMAGGAKLAGAEPLAEQFAAFGLPAWSMTVVGALEVAGAVGLWVPALSRLAAGCLAALMVGAVGAHVSVGHELGQSVPAAVLGMLCVAVVLMRPRPQQASA
ncbi:MAG: DoxX family protein [Myxococcota bacterium]